MIEFIEVIQHFEIISVFSFFFVGFIKVAVFAFAGIKGLTFLLPKKINENVINYLVGIVTFTLTFSMDNNLPKHIYVGLKQSLS